MPTILPRKRYYVALLSIALVGFAGAAGAEDLLSYMAPIGGRTSSSAAETATKDVLALNTMMFQLYGASGAIFRKNLMDHHPIILGLFTRCRWPLHPLPAGPVAARSAAGADQVSAHEVGWALDHGVVGSGHAFSG